MAEKDLSKEEVDSFKKELAEIKADMMRKELEEIKKERMRKELDELKRERSAGAPAKTAYVPPPAQPVMSLPTLIASALMLLIAGYLFGTAYATNVAASIDDLLKGFALPISGSLVVAAIALLLAAFGAALMTIVRK